MSETIIRGKKAHLYDLQQIVNGASLVYQTAISLLPLKVGDSLLDIGCGTGTILRKLNTRYGPSVELHGIDPSEDMIALAQSQAELQTANVHLQVAGAQDLHYPDSTFDWVICSLTTHHLSDEVRTAMYKEIWRVLKPQGSVLISDFHYPKTTLGQMVVNMFMRKHAHIPDLIKTTNETMLADAGFKAQKVVYQKPFRIVQHIVADK